MSNKRLASWLLPAAKRYGPRVQWPCLLRVVVLTGCVTQRRGETPHRELGCAGRLSSPKCPQQVAPYVFL